MAKVRAKFQVQVTNFVQSQIDKKKFCSAIINTNNIEDIEKGSMQNSNLQSKNAKTKWLQRLPSQSTDPKACSHKENSFDSYAKIPSIWHEFDQHSEQNNQKPMEV